MKRTGLFILTLLILFILGCGSRPSGRNYYVIDYNPVPENPQLILEQPLPYKVQVPDSRISRVFDRSQVVFRYSPHRIEYSSNDLWAVRLSTAIPDVLTKHFVLYNTFSVTQREFLVERPEFEIVTLINEIQLLQSEYYQAVHINMDMLLRRGDDLTFLVRHSFNREHEVFTDDVEISVQNLSHMIREETDIFIEKILYHFGILHDDEN